MSGQKQFSFDLGVKEDLLISLQIGPFTEMKQGVKKYEYRRKFIDRPSRAFIYVSTPVKAVCAVAEFGVPVLAPPNEIAAIAEREKEGSTTSRIAILGWGVLLHNPICFFDVNHNYFLFLWIANKKVCTIQSCRPFA